MRDKNWVKIFKGLGNESRLKILKLLWPDRQLPVVIIASSIKLSLKSTSKHLRQLTHLGILEPEGKKGSVYYALSSELHAEVEDILKKFC